MDNNNNNNTFRSSIYQMLFSYFLRCVCYIVGHSLNPSQMKRLSFVTNNFINHDVINFNSLIKNETNNPFSSLQSDNRIKKRRRNIDNLTTSNKSSIKHSSFTKTIDPDSDPELYDFRKMYYDIVLVKNNQEEEVVRLLKREKELLEDKKYWKDKYLKLVETNKALDLPDKKKERIYMNNVTIGHGSVINCDKEVPVFNSPDIDLSTGKQNNQVYHQTYDNHTKTVNDNKTINTTKIINKDDKQLKADLKNIIFQEFEKLTVNSTTIKNKNLGAGSVEGNQYHTVHSIPSYQSEKIAKLQELVSDIQRDEKSVIATLTYNQTKYYHFINGLVVNDSVRWNELNNVISWVDKFKSEFLSHLFDEKYERDIEFFCSSTLNAKKKYTHIELKLIILSLDDVYLHFFMLPNLFKIFFVFIELCLKARELDSYKKSLLIKKFILSNKSYFNSYVDNILNCSSEITKFNRDIKLPEEKQKEPLPYGIMDESWVTDLNHDKIWDQDHTYDFNYEHGHNMPFPFDPKTNQRL